ncbi:hypothetical protein GCM10020255_035910 [Rhodococcus baikonurensis]
MSNRKIFVQDVTLRDGMHAVRHRISPTDVKRIVTALDAAGVDAIEVAHGDGLAGGSLNYGPGSNTDWEWIEAAAEVLEHARLTTLLLPGVGTISELKHAYDLGVRSVRVATHCTEADVSAQHIETAREIGMDVSGFLMMSHMAPAEELAKQAKLMESYGAHCVYVTDSGGRLVMNDVADRVRAYRDILDEGTEIGIHAHENLSLSVANSVVAVQNGVTRVDASLAGHGAGAGNCPSRPSSPLRTSRSGSTAATCSPCRMLPTTSSVHCRTGRSASIGRPHTRLRRRVLELPAPRRDCVGALRNRRSHTAARSRTPPSGGWPGGHDRRHRAHPRSAGDKGSCLTHCPVR